MAKSLNQQFIEMSVDTGVPVMALWYRYNHDRPLDAPSRSPVDRERAMAYRRGEKKYEGKPCRVCGNPVRHVASGQCVLYRDHRR